MSVALPAVNGTTTRTGLFGYPCPNAAGMHSIINSAVHRPSFIVGFLQSMRPTSRDETSPVQLNPSLIGTFSGASFIPDASACNSSNCAKSCSLIPCPISVCTTSRVSEASGMGTS